MGGAALILLDTHIWIWLNSQPSLVPKQIVKLNSSKNEDDQFALSVISLWEVALAIDKGRIQTTLTPKDFVDSWLRDNHVRILPLDGEVALLSRSLSFGHDDPGDRFIAATAHSLGIPLATTDARLQALPWLQTIPN